jgi:DNA-binding response OmpR family regulator
VGRARIPRVGAESSRGFVQQKERIVVVEPNDLILGLLERWLGEAGYTVVVETWQRLRQAVGGGANPHLVIIDVPTPRSAQQLIRSVREMHDCPILLLSASFVRDVSSSISVARQFGVRKVLQKPFTRGELLLAVGEAIAGQ